MTYQQVMAVTRVCRYCVRRRSWEPGLAIQRAQWSRANMDRYSPKHNKSSAEWIHFTAPTEWWDRWRAAGKLNSDLHPIYYAQDGDDWVLANHDTIADVNVLSYCAAMMLAQRGVVVRRQWWPHDWALIKLRQQGQLDDGMVICEGCDGQIGLVTQDDREAQDWVVVE